MKPDPRTFSLRSRVILTGGALSLLVVAIAAGLFVIGGSAWATQQDALADLLEELRIGEEIQQGVLSQLAAITAMEGDPSPSLPDPFEAAGDRIHTQLRLYLFRDLGPEERLQLEAMGQAHRHLEVYASRVMTLAALGRDEEARLARHELFGSAQALLIHSEALLALRQGRLERLQARQAEFLRITQILLGGTSLIALLGTLLLVQVLARRLVAPLEQLVDASGRLSEGDFSVRVPEADLDREFETVAHAFNDMAESLHSATIDLETRNQALEEALQTIKETQGQLIQSEKLSALGRMTAGLAHELNNPLASVLGYGQLLRDHLRTGGGLDPASLEGEYLTPILNEAERAQYLVRHFLGFARQGGSTLGPVDLASVVRTVVDLRRYAFAQQGLSIEVASLPQVHILGEAQMLKGVILNLVNNAEEAMAPQGMGTLRIEGQEDGEEVVLHFLDDGPGLAHPERLFEPFYTTKPPGQGTGLGLSVVHQVLEAFGGKADGGNRPDGGAWFSVTLLRTGAPPHQDSPSVTEGTRKGGETDAGRPHPAGGEREADGGDSHGGTIGALTEAGGGQSPRTSPSASLHRPRVLVVEDEGMIRALHARLLRRMGFEPLLAEDATAARRILMTEPVDAVVSDIKMPGESGLEFYRWLSEAHPHLAKRFLFVTGNVAVEDVKGLLEQHPDRFITKPFDIAEYMERIGRLVQAPTPAPHGDGANA